MGIGRKSSKNAKEWRKKEWLPQGKKKKCEMEEKGEIHSLPIKGNPRGEVSYMETNDAKKKSTMHPLHIVSENRKRFLHYIKENLHDMEKEIES